MTRAPFVLPAIAFQSAIIAQQPAVTIAALLCAVAIAAMRRDIALGAAPDGIAER